MIKYLPLLLLVCLSAKSQEIRISGKIQDELKEPLRGVSVYVNGELITKSDCQGRFKLRANEGDTLRLQKMFFETKTQIISKGLRRKHRLFVDSKQIISYLDKLEKEGVNLSRGCQPLYVIDWMPYTGSGFVEIKPEDIRATKVVKGSMAYQYFGKPGRNGTILVFTHCPLSEEPPTKL